jgi:hypothetical protein
MAPEMSAVVASVPELNVFRSSLTLEPNFDWNVPFCTATIAGACVTFGKYPSRSVTDAADPSPELPAAEFLELLPHAARSSESAATAASAVRSGRRVGLRREGICTVVVLRINISTKSVDKIE